MFVLFDNDNEINSQRYYIGPIISQPQFFEHQTFGATALLRGGIEANSPVRRTSEGAFSKDDDIAIYPGHGPNSNIKIEKMTNPFMR